MLWKCSPAALHPAGWLAHSWVSLCTSLPWYQGASAPAVAGRSPGKVESGCGKRSHGEEGFRVEVSTQETLSVVYPYPACLSSPIPGFSCAVNSGLF